MIVDTSHPQYVAALEDLQRIKGEFVSRYAPIMKRMTPDELRWLHQRDPLLREFVDIYKKVGSFAKRAGVDI